jgi:phosphoribosylformylglycinamidine (FGAM) synthase-like amidotransferase family enzyme
LADLAHVSRATMYKYENEIVRANTETAMILEEILNTKVTLDIDLLKDQDQIVLQFKDKNPNGSMEDITSVCDESGLVCAMMPHPERACEEILGSSDGLNFFKGFL